MKFLSVCSGIEAASCALEPLGFTPVGFAEIDKAASRVLAHHYPHVPNYGDFTLIEPQSLGKVDWLIGGTPCQAFSIAGKRLSLQDARGNLTLAYAVLAHELVRHNGLRGCLWENVPGCLSSHDNAFGCFMGELVGSSDALLPCECPARGRSNVGWTWKPFRREPVVDDDGNETGEFVERPEGHVAKWPRAGMADGPRGRLAWTVKDAQYFGLAQRRERVFVVASFGDRADPAAILFERASLSGNPAPRREAREGIASTLEASAGRRCGQPQLAENLIAATLSAARAAACANAADLETYVPVAFGGNNQSGPIDVSTTLNAHGGPAGRLDFESETFITHALRGEGFDASEDGTGRGTPIVPIAFDARQSDVCVYGDRTAPLDTDGFSQAVAFDMRGREGGAQFEGPHDTANIRAASGGSSRSYVAQVAPTLNAVSGGRTPGSVPDDALGLVAHNLAVRRLTPRECERLQGFPDGWTAGQADGPRYRQLGNSMAVPVIAWLGKQILADFARHESAAV